MQRTVKIDEKGRITIPAELREKLGDTVTLESSSRGITLVPGANRDLGDDLIRILESEPKRTGRPRNPRPAQMKSIWRDTDS